MLEFTPERQTMHRTQLTVLPRYLTSSPAAVLPIPSIDIRALSPPAAPMRTPKNQFHRVRKVQMMSPIRKQSQFIISSIEGFPGMQLTTQFTSVSDKTVA